MPCDILRKKLKDTSATKIFKMVALRAYTILGESVATMRYDRSGYAIANPTYYLRKFL